jgi:hypothetical protein
MINQLPEVVKRNELPNKTAPESSKVKLKKKKIVARDEDENES